MLPARAVTVKHVEGQEEDDCEGAREQDCLLSAGEYDRSWHTSRVDVRYKGHLMAAHVKHLVEQVEELDAKDDFLPDLHVENEGVLSELLEEAIHWYLVDYIVDSDGDWLKLAALVALQNVVEISLVAGCVALFG